MVFSGRADRRMEILELREHPYFVGTQFHPEFRSRPGRASPPFVGLLDAVLGDLDRRAVVDGTGTGHGNEEVEV